MINLNVLKINKLGGHFIFILIHKVTLISYHEFVLSYLIYFISFIKIKEDNGLMGQLY